MIDYQEVARRWNDPTVRSDILKTIETYGVIFLERREAGAISGFGTGTLVRYRDHFGILTARHVLEAVVRRRSNVLYAPTVGIIVRNETRESGGPLPQARQPSWYRDDGKIRIAKGEEKVVKSDGGIVSVTSTNRDAYRPDLGVMLLSDRMRSNLAATSSFYNLEEAAKEYAAKSGGKPVLYRDPAMPEGGYVVMGFLGRLQKESVDEYGGHVVQPMLWCLQSTTGKKYSRPATDYVYDYRNFLVTDEKGNADTQSGLGSWGGISGSGVWEVIGRVVDGGEDRMVVEDRVVLSGVAFAEDWVRVQPTEGPPDVIYCHSDCSIYPRAIDMLTLKVW